MNKPLTLSLIIPAYNEEHHIKDCLEAISRQTVMPFEVLVIDNNSTDNTAKIAQEYPFVTVVLENTQGMICARNTGFACAKGSLLGRIDADTILPSTWVENIQKFYQDDQNSETVLSGSGYFKNVKYPEIHSFFIDMFFRTASLLFGTPVVWGPNMIIPASSWNTIKVKTCDDNPSIYEDMDITLHLKHAGIKTKRINALRVGTRQRHLNNPKDMLAYILRLPGTLKNHNDWRHYPALAAALGIFVFQYPFLYALRNGKYE